MGLLKQSTTRNLAFLMVDSTDHITGKTGLTVTVTLSKDAGAFGAAGGTVTEISSGWYKIALTTTDTNTLGDMAFHCTSTGADATDFKEQVVSLLPGDNVTVGTNNDKTGYSLTQTFPTNFSAQSIDASGRVDVAKIAGTTQTARDIGASVLLSAGTGTGQLDFTSGVVKANLAQILGTALTETAGQIAAAFKQFFNIASPTSTMNTITTVTTATNLTTNNDKTGYALSAGGVTAVQSGLATSAALATVQADTDDIQTRIPAALVSGRIDASVGAIAAGAITAASIAADAITAAKIADGAIDAATFAAGAINAAAIAADAIGASELAADAVTEIVNGVWNELESSHTTAGTFGRYLDAQVSTVGGGTAPTAAAVADAVWDEAISGHLTAGSTGAKLNGLSGASGSGAITHTFTVTSGGNPVDGALVWVTTDTAGTNTVASAVTDALGHATVFLDAGTYYAWAQRGGINFTEGASFVVA